MPEWPDRSFSSLQKYNLKGSSSKREQEDRPSAQELINYIRHSIVSAFKTTVLSYEDVEPSEGSLIVSQSTVGLFYIS